MPNHALRGRMKHAARTCPFGEGTAVRVPCPRVRALSASRGEALQHLPVIRFALSRPGVWGKPGDKRYARNDNCYLDE